VLSCMPTGNSSGAVGQSASETLNEAETVDYKEKPDTGDDMETTEAKQKPIKRLKIDNNLRIERDAMWCMQDSDRDQILDGYDMDEILESLRRELPIDADPELDEIQDIIESHVRKAVSRIVQRNYEEDARALRFNKNQRVVCKLHGNQWASGVVAALKEPHPETPWVKLPYVVKLDPPENRLICAPADNNATIRPEICFGQSEDCMTFTLICLPQRQKVPRRFRVGERVACAVEDCVADPTGAVWTAGTIREIDVGMQEAATAHLPQREWPFGVSCAPYSVELDSGSSVLVHKDEHWLIRDLEYQQEGRCQTVDQPLKRIVRQACGEFSWVMVDHLTRQVRPCGADDDAGSATCTLESDDHDHDHEHDQ